MKRRLGMSFSFQMLFTFVSLLLHGCGGTTDSAEVVYSPWDDYQIDYPSQEINALLVDSPFLYPERNCIPLDSSLELPENATIEVDEAGQELLCVWEAHVGNAPEGIPYTDVASCDKAFTQAPSWFLHPEQQFESDPALMEDEGFVEELNWVQSQAESSGCACCHSSGIASGHTSGFDVNAPQVWTDTLLDYQLVMLSGTFDEHRLFGGLPPEVNHGFLRDHTMFPTTDPERMTDFFVSEFERRGGTQEQWNEAETIFKNFFNRLSEPFSECVNPWQGIVDGRVVWEGGGDIRQFYVLETDAVTPGFPPNRDKPEGTVWAFYVSPDQAPISSDQIELGRVPEGASQVIPEDGSEPVFAPGKTYRLFATPDFQLIREISCTITIPEVDAADSEE